MPSSTTTAATFSALSYRAQFKKHGLSMVTCSTHKEAEAYFLSPLASLRARFIRVGACDPLTPQLVGFFVNTLFISEPFTLVQATDCDFQFSDCIYDYSQGVKNNRVLTRVMPPWAGLDPECASVAASLCSVCLERLCGMVNENAREASKPLLLSAALNYLVPRYNVSTKLFH